MMMKLKSTLLMATTLGAMATVSTNALADNEQLQNEAYVTITGTVGRIVDTDEFELKYTNGTIMVDTNDRWPNLFAKDATDVLQVGDQVRVSGQVDDNLFTKKEIDAYQIVLQDEYYSRVYTVNDPDRVSSPYPYTYYYAMDDSPLRLTGYIRKFESDDVFTLDYGSGNITVNVADIEFSDVNNLHLGDYVLVNGELDENLFGKRILDAKSLYRMNYYYYKPVAAR